MTKFKIWHQGDRSEALCPQCKTWQPTVFQYRSVHLAKTRVDVSDVLVGVCTVCDATVIVPQQAAQHRTSKRVDARIPKELYDILGVIAADFGGLAEPFAGGLFRYYIRELAESLPLARRIAKLGRSRDAVGTSGGRIAFRTDAVLFDRAWQMARAVAIRDQSELIRGIIVAAKQDAYDAPDLERKAAFRAIAVAAT